MEEGQRPVPAAVLRDLDVLEQIGPEIRDYLPLEEIGTAGSAGARGVGG